MLSINPENDFCYSSVAPFITSDSYSTHCTSNQLDSSTEPCLFYCFLSQFRPVISLLCLIPRLDFFVFSFLCSASETFSVRENGFSPLFHIETEDGLGGMVRRWEKTLLGGEVRQLWAKEEVRMLGAFKVLRLLGKTQLPCVDMNRF